MDETYIGEIWSLFREYIEKKNINTAAEKFVDLLSDNGVEDEQLRSVMGIDPTLDDVISEYLGSLEENE